MKKKILALLVLVTLFFSNYGRAAEEKHELIVRYEGEIAALGKRARATDAEVLANIKKARDLVTSIDKEISVMTPLDGIREITVPKDLDPQLTPRR